MATVEIKRITGKCKGCGKLHSFAVETIASFACDDGRVIRAVCAIVENEPRYLGLDMSMVDCMLARCDCGRKVMCLPVRPRESKSAKPRKLSKCDEKCRLAECITCNCECGGANHGIGRIGMAIAAIKLDTNA